MSKIGYIRVSTEHQETARQQEIMCDYGEWKSNITGRDFMRRMGSVNLFMRSANTFYRRVREYEATHGIAELSCRFG